MLLRLLCVRSHLSRPPPRIRKFREKWPILVRRKAQIGKNCAQNVVLPESKFFRTYATVPLQKRKISARKSRKNETKRLASRGDSRKINLANVVRFMSNQNLIR